MRIYGPATMLVMTRRQAARTASRSTAEIGDFILTHPNMQVPAETQRIRHQRLERALLGAARCSATSSECRARSRPASRGADFNMRWIASLVAEVHRILDARRPVHVSARQQGSAELAGRLRLLYEANPMAMIIEQAGRARLHRPRADARGRARLHRISACR